MSHNDSTLKGYDSNTYVCIDLKMRAYMKMGTNSRFLSNHPLLHTPKESILASRTSEQTVDVRGPPMAVHWRGPVWEGAVAPHPGPLVL